MQLCIKQQKRRYTGNFTPLDTISFLLVFCPQKCYIRYALQCLIRLSSIFLFCVRFIEIIFIYKMKLGIINSDFLIEDHDQQSLSKRLVLLMSVHYSVVLFIPLRPRGILIAPTCNLSAVCSTRPKRCHVSCTTSVLRTG